MLFFFQAEDGIRDLTVTGVQTCALPIFTTVVHSRWALFAQVHQVFSPEMRYLSPFLTARHLIPAESLPASGSVNAAAASSSPVHRPGRNFFFCSSVPFACTKDAVMIMRVITDPTDSQALDSSSATMAIESVSRPLPP